MYFAERKSVCVSVCVFVREVRASASEKRVDRKNRAKPQFGDIIRQRGAMFLTLSRNTDDHPRHAMAPTWRKKKI